MTLRKTLLNSSHLLQAVIHCEIVRQAARVVAMDRERLRSGDRAHVRFRFLQRPEYLTPGTPSQRSFNNWMPFLFLRLSCGLSASRCLPRIRRSLSRLNILRVDHQHGTPWRCSCQTELVLCTLSGSMLAAGGAGSPTVCVPCRDALCIPGRPHEGHRHGGQL